MAWISVHEQVTGGKLRELAKHIGCSQNEALGILIRFWLWGINNADKYGRIIGADKSDVADVLVAGLSKDLDAGDVVEALIDSGWVDCEDDNLYIHDWEEWQEQWYKAKELREKDAARKREERKRKKQETQPPAPVIPAPEPKTQEAEPAEKPAEKPEKKPKSGASGYSSGFEEFWKVYPRKVGKGDAYKKYKARLNDGYSEEALLQAAKNYAARCVRERTEEKYIKHAKTFLSDTLPFTDYIREERRQTETAPGDDGSNPFRK